MTQLWLRCSAISILLFICINTYSACATRNSKPSEQSQPQNTANTSLESNTPVSPESSKSKLVIETISTNEKRASFAGVSFVYGASLFPEVRAEIVPAHPLECEDCKPDSNYPQHIRFCFASKESSKEGYPFCYPEFVIFKIEDFKQAFSISKSMVEEIDQDIASLQRLLSKKSLSYKDKIPYLEYLDASRAFQAHVKRIEFQNGTGVLFLTDYQHEEDYIHEELDYLFQGLTNDGKYSVKAWFPVVCTAFPQDTYRMPESFFQANKYHANAKKQEAYCLRMERKINALSPDKFQPALTEIENLIRSIRIEDSLNQ